MLPNCTATFLTTRLYGDTRALPKTSRRLFLLQDCSRGHTNRLHGGGRHRGFCHFFDYQTARGQPPWLWLLFPHRKPIVLNIVVIIIHLLHSCIHCDLDHSCSKLHKSRDLHFCIGREIFTRGREILSTNFPPLSWQPWPLSNLAPEGRESRDRGSGGGTFILEENFRSPGLYLTDYYCHVTCAADKSS